MFPKISQMVVALAAVASSSVYAADCVSGAQTTGSCTVPAGISSMTISITGGGGGGGDGASSTYNGGGGGGGNCTLTNFAVTAGSALTISVGAGGTSPPAGFIWGTPGGDSSVVLGGTTYQGGAGSGGFSGSTGGQAGAAAHGPGGVGGSATCTGGTSTAGQNGAMGTALTGGAGGAGGDSPPPGAAGGDGGLATVSGSSGLGGSVVLTFASASVATVPTLSEWAMIFLASLMGMLAIRRMRPQ